MSCWLVVLNALTPLISFLGTLAIGCFATYIAHGQWRTNKDKLKLDLYDRRLAVYEATMKFVLGLSGNPAVDAENMRQYLIATRQATFLFDDETLPQYLKKLATEAIRLNRAINETDNTSPDPKWELLDWFSKQEKIIEEKFAPYLQLRG